MTKEQLLSRIKAKVDTHKTQKDAAKSFDISAQHLCDILAGKRDIGPSMLKGIGYRRVVTYQKVS